MHGRCMVGGVRGDGEGAVSIYALADAPASWMARFVLGAVGSGGTWSCVASTPPNHGLCRYPLRTHMYLFSLESTSSEACFC
jgi:hypothetical protein